MGLMGSTKQLEYLTDKDWTLVLHKAQTLTFRPGEEIIRQGSQSGMIYFIRAGLASVRATTAGGTSDIAMLGPDDICGEMAFLENGAATAAVIAKEQVTVAAITVKELQELFETFPGIASRFYRSLALALARRLRETSRQLVLSRSRPSLDKQ